MRGAPQIYLASRSPRRGELLAQLSVRYTVLPSEVDESVLPGEAPEHYVMRLAQEKAKVGVDHVYRHALPLLPVLAADTTVCLDSLILGKPDGDQGAATMLRALSDRWHTVHTAVALAQGERVEVALSSTQVEVAPLTDAEIAAYVASGEPHDKAGGYGIQGLGGAFVRRIEGSFTGVIGLPVYETVQLLKRFGMRVL